MPYLTTSMIRPLVKAVCDLAYVLKGNGKPGDEPMDYEVIAELFYGLYGDEAIEKIEQVLEKAGAVEKAWNASDHPRGKNGRFIPKGSAEAVSSAQEAVRKVMKGDYSVKPQEIADHLSILTMKQIRALAAEHGRKVPKVLKADLIESVKALVGKPADSETKPEGRENSIGAGEVEHASKSKPIYELTLDEAIRSGADVHQWVAQTERAWVEEKLPEDAPSYHESRDFLLPDMRHLFKVAQTLMGKTVYDQSGKRSYKATGGIHKGTKQIELIDEKTGEKIYHPPGHVWTEDELIERLAATSNGKFDRGDYPHVVSKLAQRVVDSNKNLFAELKNIGVNIHRTAGRNLVADLIDKIDEIKAAKKNKEPSEARKLAMERARALGNSPEFTRITEDEAKPKGETASGKTSVSDGGGKMEREHPIPEPSAEDVAEQINIANQMRRRSGKDPLSYQLKLVDVDSVTPSQTGEDYDNASSRDLAERTRGGKLSERRQDNYPIAVDENGKIIDGNHRHAAATINGKKKIWAIVPETKPEGEKMASGKAEGETPMPVKPDPAISREVDEILNSHTQWHKNYTLPKTTVRQMVDNLLRNGDSRYNFVRTITDQGWATNGKYAVKATPGMVEYAQSKGVQDLQGRTPNIDGIIPKKRGEHASIVGGRKNEHGDNVLLFQADNNRQMVADSKNVAAVTSLYPKADWELQDTGMLIARQDGEIVGLVMGMGDVVKPSDKHYAEVKKGGPRSLADRMQPGPYSSGDVMDEGGRFVVGHGTPDELTVRITGSAKSGYSLSGGNVAFPAYATVGEAKKAAREILSYVHGKDDDGTFIFKPRSEGDSPVESNSVARESSLSPEAKRHRDYYANLREKAKSKPVRKEKIELEDDRGNKYERELAYVGDHFAVHEALPEWKRGKPRDGGYSVRLTGSNNAVAATFKNKTDAVKFAHILEAMPDMDWSLNLSELKEKDPERSKQMSKRFLSALRAFENNEYHPDMGDPERLK